LGLLTQQSVSGYDIKRLLNSLGWLVGEPSFGSLYPALAALEEDGLATVVLESRQNRPPRKVYSITEEGRRTLEEWISRPSGPNASLKAFAMRLILADNLTQAGLIAQLYQRRSQIAAHRAALEKNAIPKADGANSGQRLALEYGLALANAELAWLDSTLDRLSRQPQAMEVVKGD
jgi:DNA-binding PadR family transcriptional regulator